MNGESERRRARLARLDEVMTREIVKRILAVAHPDRIIVFGSAAKDEMTEDSDIDVLVLESQAEDPREETHRIRAALIGLGAPFDVVVMSTQRFEETKHVIGGIAYPAHKYGTLVYEAA